jgi:hypothetical protein
MGAVDGASAAAKDGDMMKISTERLTTCEMGAGGKSVLLNFLDETGESVCLEVSFEHAQSIAMTLPRILSCAVRSISGSPQSRFVFPLGEWTLEIPEGHDGLILTLATTDGFSVSFGIPGETCRSLGWTLATGRDPARAEADDKLETRDALATPRVH